MTWLARARFFNATVALMAVIAWLLATNHCLLGVMKQPRNVAVSMPHCAAHSKMPGGADHGPSAMLACCKGLQSRYFNVAETKIAFSRVLAAIQLFAIGRVVLPEAPKSILMAREYDAQPLPPGFFVKIVLGRSLRENAPPTVS